MAWKSSLKGVSMEDVKKTPLGEFRGKAKLVTFISSTLVVVFVFIAAGFAATAQSKYSSYLASNSSLTSTISTTYFRSYQSAKSISDVCAAIAAVCGGAASFSIFAWIGANLHIASIRTRMWTSKAEAVSPMPESSSSSSAPSVAPEVAARKANSDLPSEIATSV